MALKMRKSRTFPTRQQLIDFAYDAGVPRANAAAAIDEIADNLNACLNSLAEIEAMPGLKDSMAKHLTASMHQTHLKSAYRHQKKRKYQ